ncbi:lysophospholipid acyltransferase family protein [Hahella aquimaris]|uniref:lysophospholipid acyltransferase family protein n=1 Tax=Hahella sp. HNIBRBA332 TaxID=3015983 RepID=UPI00273BD1FA|nr:lysophospholipid acyltransferase family protein [Hahella sp. HNIBRBA332]WLQ11553.1 lysophospholipid acyltransferase family protein [Hahella sp. HNIBRBA332]
MNSVRLFLRASILIPYLMWGAVLAAVVSVIDAIKPGRLQRAPIARFWLAGLCRVLNLRIHASGELHDGPVMVISNHISWLDIPVLGAIKPLHFLSKAEVRSWPFIGWLAAQAGTLFITRGGGKARQVVTELESCMRDGATTLIFPEGTTTDGQRVKKFHGRLLNAAIQAQVPIQPITLHYRRDNVPDAYAPFIGDDEFVSHLVRLMKATPTDVYVAIHPVMEVAMDTPAESVARTAQQQVETSLQQMYWSNDPKPDWALADGVA